MVWLLESALTLYPDAVEEQVICTAVGMASLFWDARRALRVACV